MRLTLRTMLAYMDDILEQEDAQEIGRKIEESELATNLMHRIRDVTRRLRLGAPHPSDQGAGLDPNTVAEYLDNTLPADRVPDFEKVCLESDVHLAEVAACHQILTLVLGEPAEVDPVSRQRMYQLPDLAAAQAKTSLEMPAIEIAESPAGDGQVQAAARKTPRRARPAIPDYLREEAKARRRRWAIVATILLLAGLGVVGWGLRGPLEIALRPGENGGLGRQDRAATQTKPAADPPLPAKASSPAAAPVEVPVEAPAEVEPIEALSPPKAPMEAKPAERTPVEAEPAAPEAPVPEALAPSASESPDPVKPDEAAAAPPGPEGAPAEPQEVAMLPGVPGLSQPEIFPEAAPQATGSAERAPLPPLQVGTYVSPREVLLKQKDEAFRWERLTDQAPLASGDLCLSLPTFRPVIILDENLHLQLIDATRVAFLPDDPPGGEKSPGVLVDYGRVVIASEGKTKTDLWLQIGQRKAIVRFTDEPATLAVQVGRGLLSGAHPEAYPTPPTAELYVARGRILWEDEGSREVVSFSAPAEVRLSRLPAVAEPLEAVPTWIDVAAISLLDQRASATIERALEPSKPVLLTLRELAQHRQREVRWLALRCLAAIDDFQLLVTALDNPEHKTMWQEYADLLRAAVVRSPQSAARVRVAIEQVYGGTAKAAAAATLYELLWRYTPDRLTADDAAQLVSYLEHETLAVRVLAFWNLKNITGMGLFYRPEDPAIKREPSVQKWKERLKDSPTLRARAEGGLGSPAPPR